jgi:uncharacterized protein (TIGR02145 family)/prepilin-type N-terminal cleavage/methylation domain-containing protein
MFPSKNQRNQFNQRNLRFRRLQPAFTLIELLVVIAIIGLLATLSVIALNNARAKSRDAKRLADAKQFQTAMELYFNAAGRYPSNAEFQSGKIEYNTGNGTTTYMQVIPSAPTPADGTCDDTANTYSYNAPADGSTYSISFCVAQASPDLGGGELTVWSGGISGGNGGNGGGGGGNIVACSAATTAGSTCSYGGKNYRTVLIGGQTWMKDNLNIGTFIGSGNSTSGYDGNPGTSDDCVVDSNSGYMSCQGANGFQKYCYSNDIANCDINGGLYEWTEAMGFPAECNNADFGYGYSNCGTATTYTIETTNHQGICPTGWHVPSLSDLDTLAQEADTNNSCTIYNNCYSAGDKLKTSSWEGGDNYGFSMLPAGEGTGDGNYSSVGSSAYLWTASPYTNTDGAFSAVLYSGDPGIYGEWNYRSFGFSVRCVKN